MNVTYYGVLPILNGLKIQEVFLTTFLKEFQSANVNIRLTNDINLLDKIIKIDSATISVKNNWKEKLQFYGKWFTQEIFSHKLSEENLLSISNYNTELFVPEGFQIKRSIVSINGLNLLFRSYYNDHSQSDVVTVHLTMKFRFEK